MALSKMETFSLQDRLQMNEARSKQHLRKRKIDYTKVKEPRGQHLNRSCNGTKLPISDIK